MGIKTYRQLEVWQKSIELVVLCYNFTKNFPTNEIYGITNQIRRSAISIPSNIAEGQSKWSTKEFLRHLSMSNGSLSELETQLIISDKLNYIKKSELNQILSLTEEIGKMINGLKKSLTKKLKQL